MSKRFTESSKWDDPWFQALSPVNKCFWSFILDRCDIAGIWVINWRAAEFFIGEKLDQSEILEQFSKRIVALADGEHWFIPKFITYQYKQLSETSTYYKPICKILKKYNLLDGVLIGHEYPIDTPSIPHQCPIDTLQVKEKDKEEDKYIGGFKGGDLSVVPNTFEDFKKEMLNSEDWMTEVAHGCQKEVAVVRKFLITFIHDRKTDGDWQKSFFDHKKHFRNWLKKQLTPGSSVKGNQQAEITTYPGNFFDKNKRHINA